MLLQTIARRTVSAFTPSTGRPRLQLAVRHASPPVMPTPALSPAALREPSSARVESPAALPCPPERSEGSGGSTEAVPGSPVARSSRPSAAGRATPTVDAESSPVVVQPSRLQGPESADPPPAADHAPKRSRAEQSRINGANSRGPKTSTGKSVARFNALKHGLTSACVLMPGEDRTLFDAWVTDFHHELRPVGTVQESLVQRAAEIAWRLRRLPMLEANVLGKCSGDPAADPEQWMKGWAKEILGETNDGVLMRLQRYEVRLERSYSNCLRELRQLQRQVREEPDDGRFDEPTELERVVADVVAEVREEESGSLGEAEAERSGSFGAAEEMNASDGDVQDDAEAGDGDGNDADGAFSGSFGTSGATGDAGEREQDEISSPQAVAV